MNLISFSDLDFEHQISVTVFLVFAVLNLILAVLFSMKYKLRKSKSIKYLVYIQILASCGLLAYVFRNFLGDSEFFHDLFKNMYLGMIMLCPFLLVRFLEDVFETESKKLRGRILFIAMALVMILTIIFTQIKILSYLLYLIIFIMLIEIGYYIVYQSIKLKKQISYDPVASFGLVIMAISGIFFILFMILMAAYDLADSFPLKIFAFVFYALFTVTIYLGYYYPSWLKDYIKMRSHNKKEKRNQKE